MAIGSSIWPARAGSASNPATVQKDAEGALITIPKSVIVTFSGVELSTSCLVRDILMSWRITSGDVNSAWVLPVGSSICQFRYEENPPASVTMEQYGNGSCAGSPSGTAGPFVVTAAMSWNSLATSIQTIVTASLSWDGSARYLFYGRALACGDPIPSLITDYGQMPAGTAAGVALGRNGTATVEMEC